MPTNDPYRLGKKYVVTDRWLPTSSLSVPPTDAYSEPYPWPSSSSEDEDTSEEELVEEIIYLKYAKRKDRSPSPILS